MSKLKRILTSIVVVVGVVGIVAGGVTLRKKRLEQVEAVRAPLELPWAVATADVVQGPIERVFPALGHLTSSAEITIASQFSGTILELGPREGKTVEKGDLLVRIDTRDIDEQIAAMQAQVDASKVDSDRLQKELDRERSLLKSGGSSESQLEARESAAVAASKKVTMLERQVASLQVKRGFATVTAPAAGMIASRMVEEGDLCSAYHPVYLLAAAGGARLGIKVPQEIMAQVGPGTQVTLVHGEEQSTVAITRIHPDLDSLALGTLEADLAGLPFGLPSGARIPVRVVLDRRAEAWIVPQGALLRSGDDPTAILFVAVEQEDGARVKKVTVTLDLVGKNGIAILGAVKSGDRAVVAHESVLRRLRDGDPVLLVGDRR